MSQPQFLVRALAFGLAALSCTVPVCAQSGRTAKPIYCPSTGRTIPAGTPGDQLDRLCPPSSGGIVTPQGPSPEEISKQQRLAAAHKLNEQGVTAYDEGDYATAINYFQAALEKNPEDARVKQNLSIAQDAKKQKDQEVFNRNKADALAHMKGVSPGNITLKGFDADSLGLKGISSADLSAKIKTGAPVRKLTWLAVPCSGNGCDVLVRATDLVEELRNSPPDDESELVEDWIHKVGSSRYLLVNLDGVGEEEVIQAVREMNEKTIKLVQKTLKGQIARLNPFYWDTPAVSEEKREAIKKHETELQAMINDVRALRPAIPLPNGQLQFYFGDTFKRVIRITSSGSWGHL